MMLYSESSKELENNIFNEIGIILHKPWISVVNGLHIIGLEELVLNCPYHFYTCTATRPGVLKRIWKETLMHFIRNIPCMIDLTRQYLQMTHQ